MSRHVLLSQQNVNGACWWPSHETCFRQYESPTPKLIMKHLVALVLCTLAATSVFAEEGPRTKLPSEHEYQRALHKYLSTLTEKDFDLGVTEKFTKPLLNDDADTQFRYWLMNKLIQPLVGTKRGMPAINAPARLFTLAAIETPAGVME